MMVCAVCGKEDAAKRNGVKRPLCQKCYEAAVGYSNAIEHKTVGGNWRGHLPADGGRDSYEGRYRYMME